jgi:hypothetical protein
MIVRILAEGQYRVDGDQLEAIKELDQQLMAAVMADDEASFRRLLHEVVAIVRGGKPLGSDHLGESDLILPPADTTLAEAKQFFA